MVDKHFKTDLNWVHVIVAVARRPNDIRSQGGCGVWVESVTLRSFAPLMISIGIQ